MTEAVVSSQNRSLKWVVYAGVVAAVTADALQNWTITIVGGLTVVAVTALIPWCLRKLAASYFLILDVPLTIQVSPIPKR